MSQQEYIPIYTRGQEHATTIQSNTLGEKEKNIIFSFKMIKTSLNLIFRNI